MEGDAAAGYRAVPGAPPPGWWRGGEPQVWANAAAVSISLIAVVGLLGLLATRGLAHFWPQPLVQMETQYQGDERTILGEIVSRERVSAQQLREAGWQLDSTQDRERSLIRRGVREAYAADYAWVIEDYIVSQTRPAEAVTVERYSGGKLFGYIEALYEEGEQAGPNPDSPASAWDRLQLLLQTTEDERAGADTLSRAEYTIRLADGGALTLPLKNVVRMYRPNDLGSVEKITIYGAKLWEFMSTGPREANSEGGVFPAIFGTVMMVILMSIIVMPFGVVAAVYLREYASQGLLTRLIRIAVNNLAGVPSIVYGIFGLGFFVYFLGGEIDQLFFSDTLPSPTFGTPGLLWSSLTLALLTLPVVIVATEEGLARIPATLREGSMALGATRAETLRRVVIPAASPAIMTGLILAVARAAGEVAPLMLVGVVKVAPSLPVDGTFPYLHLDQKFMHLGFHIYDVGFQAPNVEAARPLVYATALLLVVIIAVLNITAVTLRNRIRERYKALES
ncbi:MAG: phosphate ABC transporter permease PstA [Pseudomonadota bacterium]